MKAKETAEQIIKKSQNNEVDDIELLAAKNYLDGYNDAFSQKLKIHQDIQNLISETFDYSKIYLNLRDGIAEIFEL